MPYNRDYFVKTEGTTAAISAEVLVPVVLDLIQPRSVVDVGCGTGEFLRVFAKHGVADILGIDGKYLDRSLLAIPETSFRAVDIRQPFTLSRTFDLALCLEVGEHLDAVYAATLVTTLTSLAPVVLFSAAIPEQGGAHHVNEQWPDYWAELFAEHAYVPVDAIRKRIWDDGRISVWYRQNSLLFCVEECLSKNSKLSREAEATCKSMLSVVHPVYFGRPAPSIVDRIRRQLRQIPLLRALYYRITYPNP